MTIINWTWLDKDGNEMDEHDGYFVRDYFDTPLDELLEGQDRTPQAVRSLLRAAYRGPDSDGVGLRWVVV